MKSDLLNDVPTNGIDRGERCHRILEDHSNLFAADRAHRFIGALEKILTFEENFTRDANVGISN